MGYYRTSEIDQQAIKEKSEIRIDVPILAIGGLFAMGAAVGEGMNHVGNNVTSVVLKNSGHYPAEQEPSQFANELLPFLNRHSK